MANYQIEYLTLIPPGLECNSPRKPRIDMAVLRRRHVPRRSVGCDVRFSHLSLYIPELSIFRDYVHYGLPDLDRNAGAGVCVQAEFRKGTTGVL